MILPKVLPTLRGFLLHGILTAGLTLEIWAAPSQGNLHFKKTEAYETAQPAQAEIVARFPFENRGQDTIKILEVKTDCGCCTTADTVKKAYAPGERGEIAITFKIGAFTGKQRKGAVVVTNDPAQRLVPLSLIASLPEVLTLEKNVLLWEEKDRAEAKSLLVRTSVATPVKELRARTDSPFLSVAVERVAPTEFRVSVTPQADRRDISATLQLEAVLDGEQHSLVNAFVRVR